MNFDVIYYPEDLVLRAVEKFETPFFLYKEERIRENCKTFKKAFEYYFKNFTPLYAIKANPNPEILKIVMDEGFMMDASSESEVWISEKIKVAKKFGISGMYTGNYTTSETLKYAFEHNFILNLDDISMIPFLEEIGVPEILSFRINPGIGDSKIKSTVLAGPDAKYGIPFEKAVDAYRQAQKLGVKKFGIHMMTGSNVPIDKKDYFTKIVEKLFEVIVEIKKQTGIEIEIMNIGGGFGVPYHPDEKTLDIEEIAENIRKIFDKYCQKYNLKEPVLMAEPGRWITCDAGWLVSKVTIIKDSYKKFIGVDSSSNDMPRVSIYEDYHHISVLTITQKLEGENKQEKVSVVGTICENNDQFAKDRLLPVCDIGDVVVIHNCGAHASSMGHNYNGKLRSAEYLAKLDGSFKQIRKEETFKDLYKKCIF